MLANKQEKYVKQMNRKQPIKMFKEFGIKRLDHSYWCKFELWI